MPSWIKSVATVFFSAILHVTILLMIIGFPMPDFFGSKESVHSRFREFRQQEAAMPAACPGPLTDNLTPVAPAQTTVTSLPEKAPIAKAAAIAPEQSAKITQRKRTKAKIAPKAEEPATEEAATEKTEPAKTEPAAPEQKESKVVDVNFADKDSAKADDSEKAAESDKTATKSTTADTTEETEPAKTAEQVPADPTPEKAEPAKTEQPAAAAAEEPQKSEEKAEVKEEKPEAQVEQPAPAKNSAEVAEKPAEPKKEDITAPKETGEETIPVPVQDKIAGVQPANDNESSTEAASEDLNAPPPETEATGESN